MPFAARRFENTRQRVTRSDVLVLEMIERYEFLIADDKARLAVEHHEALRHVGKRRVEANVLRFELRFPLPQFLGARDDGRFEVTLNPVDLLDHQRDRAIGAPPVAVGLVVGSTDEAVQFFKIDSTGVVERLADLLRKKFVHDDHLPYKNRIQATSAKVVTVMVWLCSSQRPDLACGEISP